MMTSRTINAMVRDAESGGRYVYAKVCESIITGAWKRIINARTKGGVVQVKVLATGTWSELLDDGVTIN